MSVKLYLIIINIISFIVNVIDYYIFQREIYENGGREEEAFGIQPPWLINVIITFGGGFGALLSYIIFDPKIRRETIVSRIYALWWSLVWGFILYSKYDTFVSGKINKFINYVSTNQSAKFIIYFIIGINIITFFVFIINSLAKGCVVKSKFYTIFALFGTTGAYIAMDFFNMRIMKDKLDDYIPKKYVFIPILFVLKVILYVYFILFIF